MPELLALMLPRAPQLDINAAIAAKSADANLTVTFSDAVTATNILDLVGEVRDVLEAALAQGISVGSWKTKPRS